MPPNQQLAAVEINKPQSDHKCNIFFGGVGGEINIIGFQFNKTHWVSQLREMRNAMACKATLGLHTV